jgi:hypothetical protein
LDSGTDDRKTLGGGKAATMGFGIEMVLVRGRPTTAAMESWVLTALSRLRQPELQYPGEDQPQFTKVDVSLNAAGRIEAERPEEFTLLWATTQSVVAAPDRSLMSFAPFLRIFGPSSADPCAWAVLPDSQGLPRLPSDPVGEDAAKRNAFLLSLALIAQAEGFDSAFFADGSVSDSGCLIIAGGEALNWTDADCDLQRDRANELLRSTFSAVGPDLNELQWLGPGEPFWSRPLVASGRRLDSPTANGQLAARIS